MAAYLVVMMLTLMVHSAKSAKKSTLLMLKAKVLPQAANNINSFGSEIWWYSTIVFSSRAMDSDLSKSLSTVQIAEIQEMFFERLENERSVSFLMTQ
jgi:hypothetical protein